MEPIARTIQELYPDASSTSPLRVHVPPKLQLSARTWSRVVWSMCAIAATAFGIGWIGGSADAAGLNELLGGTGVTYDSDGDANALAGTWLEKLMWLSGIGAALVYGLLRASVQAPWRGDHRASWGTWAHERGLVPGAGEATVSPTSTGFGIFRDGRDRDWHGMCSGRLAGDVPVLAGATAWTTGSGRSQERHHVSFALVQLPEHVAELFPGSSLTRYLRGISDVELHEAGLDELRLESIDLDDDCEIRVRGNGDDVRWRELFDPVTIHGLTTWYDAQWTQRGRWLACVAGGSRIGSAPVETIDSLCLTAAFLHSRFVRAAEGDADAGESARASDAA